MRCFNFRVLRSFNNIEIVDFEEHERLQADNQHLEQEQSHNSEYSDEGENEPDNNNKTTYSEIPRITNHELEGYQDDILSYSKILTIPESLIFEDIPKLNLSIDEEKIELIWFLCDELFTGTSKMILTKDEFVLFLHLAKYCKLGYPVPKVLPLHILEFMGSGTVYEKEKEFYKEEELTCPISSLLMKHPVRIDKCSHNFEKEYIEHWLKENNNCPVCRIKCGLQDIKKNELLAKKIAKYLQAKKKNGKTTNK